MKLTSYVPNRYKQYWSLITLFTLPGGILCIWYLLYTSPITRKYFSHRYGRGILLLYLFWQLFIDHDISAHGGRPNEWLRNHRFWKHFRAYFPHSIIHQSGVPPDPTKKYIIGVHPQYV